MEKFTTLSGIIAPLPIVNIDTDMIIPKLFLKTIKRTGLGANLFDEMRFNEDGTEKPDFVLNKDGYRSAKILVTGANFGCGSSREHAPWSIADFGIRCIIAPSFADIFYNNCFKNGILPVRLGDENVAEITNYANKTGSEVFVDLESQTIKAGDLEYGFDVEPFRKHCLLNGLDDIGLTLAKEDKITAFEVKAKSETPWLFA
jgi:3-isopropylmalate/(R)-2-methylmalate dehydratase small subunit